MKLTKYENACVVLEKQGEKVVVDPSVYTTEFGGLGNIVAILVTHVHDDHFGIENVRKIIDANPEVAVYTTKEVASQLPDAKVVVPQTGKDYTAGSFTLRFFGELHAAVHATLPRAQNIGLSVDGTFYYPGDSFKLPDHAVNTVAVPSSGGWMKIGEAMDFMNKLPAKQYFPTHDISLSELGKTWNNEKLSNTAGKLGAKFSILKPGDSVEI